MNAKLLASRLEDEAAKLRAMKIAELKLKRKPSNNGEVKPEGDVAMAEPEDTEEDPDPEPRERGSDAVERRIEKVMSDLREQGLVDLNNDKEFEEKRVCVFYFLFF